MSPREKQDVRTRVVLAAMELFFAKGYNSTSIADILSRTQLNAGSLYHVFPGKQDVLIAVLEAYRDVAYFDRNIAILRDHFDMLLARAARPQGELAG